MSSVGVFRKVGIDEKPCFVYTLSQTDNPASSGEALAIDSGGDDLPLQPLFFCPAARLEFIKFKLKEDEDDDDSADEDDDDEDEEEDDDDEEDGDDDSEYGDDDDDEDEDDDDSDDHKNRSLYELMEDDNHGDEIHPFDSSPRFPSTRIHDQQHKSLLDCDHRDICKLPVVPLYWCNSKEPNINEFECGACGDSMASASYYACLECKRKFHKECVESPLEIRHPSHPFHPLKLYNHPNLATCFCCDTSVMFVGYHCTTCDLSMHPICAMRTVPIVIDHPKSHPHPLTFFPRQAFLPCNVCGLIKNRNPTYICIQCVFIVHSECIGFPHVIRISRHHHRVSFTSSLPTGDWSCGVCRKHVDNDYGAYSCNACDAYFVHSKCALNRDVWDGKELDGVPEEDDIIDDGEPFERIADGIILHISHSHQLRLEMIKVYDEDKFCRACAIPIYEGKFYSCMECDFILHESCANSPRMKRHPLHPHPLTLNMASGRSGFFRCDVCERQGLGFVYEHHRHGRNSFRLDLRCASVTEPFEYEGHKHPLFLALDPSEKARCQLCKYNSDGSKLNCIECDYIICFNCATLPYKAGYKHDSHLLTICDGQEASDQQDWCEACERKILVQEEEEEDPEACWPWSRKRRDVEFSYKCNDCCTALHVKCLLGKDVYMNPGKTIKEWISLPGYSRIKRLIWVEYQILPNTSLSRPICSGCLCRCPFPIFYKRYKSIFCSSDCIPEPSESYSSSLFL
ncbi:unnamed protein product [Microthlaspi erraticum]|uniref:Phorbol-ester/DAG-type domain-containing protein n=1 Tax=Microthlaspi erraticum TaxID=1685480 RepID=A0A6D2KZZ3_9BRAS|nr:unnamed protein product [Microthlaspi erraticum]